jgi:hypothetical protein
MKTDASQINAGLLVTLLIVCIIITTANPTPMQLAKDIKVVKKTLLAEYNRPRSLARIETFPSGVRWAINRGFQWNIDNTHVRESLKNQNNPFRVTVKHLNNGKQRIEITKKTTSETIYESDSYIDLRHVMAAPDGSLFLVFEMQPFGDIERYRVTLVDSNTGLANPLTKAPVSFAEFSPDSKFVLVEGMVLMDAVASENRTQTTLDINRAGYERIIGWSEDGKKLAVLVYENWEKPKWVQKWLIELE